ncbi:BTAD domain-containing putative transcriptional regulator, partial [Actinosynnema sp. NPDC023658]|uniref:AfsR/SARP family transcriptional regulator n=1 Tax=Actinosynnema sp. NPDC023658 TaxID=3155465 RepID=UPI0034036480
MELRAVVGQALEVLGPSHVQTLVARVNLAAAAFELARMDKSITAATRALPSLKQAADDVNEILGSSHPRALVALSNLASAELEVAQMTGSHDTVVQALETVGTAFERSAAVFGEDHPATLVLGQEKRICELLAQAVSESSGRHGQGTLLTGAYSAIRWTFDDEYLSFGAVERHLGASLDETTVEQEDAHGHRLGRRDEPRSSTAPRPSPSARTGGVRKESGLEFGVLGPLQVLADGRQLVIGRKGMRGLLAMLVLEANRVVPIDEIVDSLWADEPPATARTIVHGYVSRLRRMLEQADPAGSARILTAPPGYQLSVDPWRLDFHRARQLVSSARGKPAPIRAQLLRESLGLWRGQVLADVPGDPVTTDLEELRLAAVEERIEAELELGRHLELVGELRQLVNEHPLRERLVALAVRAIYRSGMRTQALEVYEKFHRRVVDELGIDPGPGLRLLHEQVLADDPSLTLSGTAEHSTVPPRPGVVVPAQLPAAASGFVGRHEELAWLDRLCDARDLAATTIAVVNGAPGVGKSELVVTWGHRRAEQFPDGLLFASLNGFAPDREPVEPAEVLARFLLALGVPADGVPRDVDDRVGLYRSVLAKRRVLVVLDDADDPEQVRLALPPGGGSVVLVTSRRRLESLVVRNGARMLTLDTLSDEESVRLVDEVVGKPLSDQEPEAMRTLAQLCGNLPLALRMTAARLVTEPDLTTDELIARLSDDDRLRTLDLADTGIGVERALAMSYRNLAPELTETFRAAGLVPGRWVSPQAIAAVCDTDLGTAAARLADLADAHLLVEQWRGGFVLHDLVRLYARGLLDPTDRATGLHRLATYYLKACDHARRLIRPVSDGLDFNHDVNSPRPATPSQALSWFDKEWPNLVALVHAGVEAGLHEQVWQLVRLVHTYCLTRFLGSEWHAIAELGLASARVIGDRRGELLVLLSTQEIDNRTGALHGTLERAEMAHRIAVGLAEPRYLVMALDKLALALRADGRAMEALGHHREAVELARREGDAIGEATSLNNLAQTEQSLGQRETAAQHQFRAMEIYHRSGDERSYVVAVNNLAELYAELGLLAEAEEHARQGVELARGGAMQFEEAFGRQVLGAVLARRGEHAAAQAELTES